MFHQNIMPWKSKSPVISWITGFCFLGCPDGLGSYWLKLCFIKRADIQ